MLKRYWSECIQWVNRLPSIPLAFLALVLSYTAAIPIIVIALVRPDISFDGPNLGSRGLVAMILLGCLIAPIIETAIFQWACIRLLDKFGFSTGYTIVISAVLFGSAHTYSPPYMVMTFVVGLVLGATFVIEDRRGGRPFLVTMAVHMMRNAVTAVYFLATA